VINLQNKGYTDYKRDGDLAKLERTLDDYWDQSRATDTAATVDLEKHLWLVNGAAATITIGFVQAADKTVKGQHIGAWFFVFGIILLIGLKFVSATNSSRDAARFREARSKFEASEVTDYEFRNVRDRVFRRLRITYLALLYGSVIAFVIGCISVLVGTYAA